MSFSHLKILIVDDEDQDRLDLEMALKGMGISPSFYMFKEVDQRFSPLLCHEFDCIFLDTELLNGDGLSVLKSIRQNGINTPVIVYSPKEKEEKAVEMLKIGASDYISKVLFNPDSLGQVILRVLRIHQVELEVEQKKLDLWEKDLLFHTLADSAPVLIWLIGEDLKYKYFNKVWTDFTGLTLAEERKRNWMDEIHPEEAKLFKKEFKHQYIKRKALEREFRLKNRDQVYRWVLSKSVPFYGPHKVFNGYIGICMDITDLKETEKKLHLAREEATAATRVKSEFLANMSHEIRTPLNAIIGMAELLRETTLNQEQKNYLKVFESASINLLGIINSVLDLAKIESGKSSLEMIHFDIKSSCQKIMNLMTLQALEKGLSLSCNIDPKVPSALYGDESKLSQILVNLVGNAIKFTEKGKVELKILPDNILSHQLVNEKNNLINLHFIVADTGPGFSKEHHQKLFERFTQADSSITRKFGGTGIGLSLSQQLCELMGGKISVESEEGKGSVFNFQIPFQEGDSSLCPNLEIESGKREDQQIITEDQRPLHILLADDYEDNRTLILAYFKKLPYQMKLAEDGQKAVDLFKSCDFDLILMDIQMPILDGMAATKIIRSWEKEQKRLPTPIVALTAYAMKEEKEKIFKSGCNTILVKPIKKAVLLEVIKKYAHFTDPLPQESEAFPLMISVDSEIKELIPGYLKRVKNEVLSLERALQEKDFSAVHMIGHKMKGVGASYGFEEITRIGSEIEAAAKETNENKIKENVGKLSTYLKRIQIS